MTTTEPCTGCPPIPDGLVRLRYFFGKRLGVADLRDEQAYHRSRMTFHNRHLHGVGVVCGLSLSPEAPVGLRVASGAALDACGHEILIPYDQCIDLDAWYRTRKAAADKRGEAFPPAGAVVDGALAVCVVASWRECPTSPETAPRDPCGCDNDGVEFGRIEEGFSLQVVLSADAPTADPALDPEVVDAILAGDAGALYQRSCGDDENRGVRLGCLGLLLGAGGVTGLTPADDWGGPDAILLSTAALQAIVLAGTKFAPKPLFTGLSIEGPLATAKLVIETDAPMIDATVHANAFEVRRLDAGGWARGKPVGVSSHTALGKSWIEITVQQPANFWKDGSRYHVLVDNAQEGPVVSDTLRKLTGDRFFQVIQAGGLATLTVIGEAP